MPTFLNKILIGCCLVLLQSHVAAKGTYSCDRAKLIISNFVNSKQDKDWSKIRGSVYKLQNCKCEMAPVFYYIYRIQVVLPNSHTLQGISPHDFISNQKLKMSEQVKILKGCEKKSYLPLIYSMITQDFDAEITAMAKDLNKQLTD